MNKTNNHTYVICAYKNSPYIEECIHSLKCQKEESIIKLATSTPSSYLEDMCKRYEIDYCVRQGESGIAEDWNYAYSLADTDYVTIVHQDDVYYPDYGRCVMDCMKNTDDTLIVFTDYAELRNGTEHTGGVNLCIKRLLLVPVKRVDNNNVTWRKRFIIRFGNAICCPSVTYNKKMLDRLIAERMRDGLFHKHFRSNLDWELWEWLSRENGRFVFVPKILMSHRIHEGSETSATLRDNERNGEDYEMFVKFWPKWLAKIITKTYRKSEKDNIIHG